MKRFRRILVAVVALLVAVVATACSNKSNSSKGGYTPKSLTIQFVPSQAATKLQARAKPLEKMLSKRLGIPVHVSMSTDYNTVVEAMKSKKVDVGFLPPDGYVLAHKQGAADLLLQAERYGVKQPGGKATNQLVKSYRAEILVKKGSKIKNWKDLKGKSISVQNPTSSAGYVFPVAELKQKGLDVTKSCKLVTVTGHDQAVLNVLNGDTDAAFVFEDARNIVKKDNPKIMSQVVPIYFTKPIPNDTISVIPSMSKSFRKKLAKAFIAVGKSKEGKKVIESVYSHEGYAYAKDSDFNVIRKYDKIVESTKK
ncbi:MULTISPECIES: phosphate/phosphite/phosphonate ABC transporter substrate-binding protein [Lactobacillus]|jgi:phosphonate transport system substrate-binding protein|uniref:Phosphonate ABC transporter, phosphonate-binding protein n=2 Tax=Lactobacillus TaxID=1578 RepID=D5H0Q8_LACCS|nr:MULTISPECIES: phosphate/phosphite/phosphonate ABC transporter substrate-binding protein [Lactobacillus]MBI1695251.1 phosphonate ABC transporter substrate-binding protein [Lactobacillus crispatus]MBL1071198.1 phosphate/phosphite/phosphonate ABC transporter substrate-binding protein [Lactobacillus kitasatonis]MDU7066141.1 phosphate/phosphite/phosphonate ABC transporter substrate-binding protein [Lactobacillus crispatus]CBL49593.1 Phosphonate ABC transporter, phosphonate-binding protein [Lactob